MHESPAAATTATRSLKIAEGVNNFDAVRLIAALLVLCSHQFYLLGEAQPAFAEHTLGETAVMVFFIISGYLVAQSWYRDPHLMRFLLRRLLRLWPALAVATLAIAAAGALLTILPLHDYLGHATWQFVAKNLQFRTVYQLPGVFPKVAYDPGASAVNGSWWSIPLEFKCYLYLALLGLIGLRRRWVCLLALAVLLVQAGHGNAVQPLYTAFFLSGVCAWQFRSECLRFRGPLLVAGVALVAVAIAAGAYWTAEWLVLVPATLVAGSASTPGIQAAGVFGDLSYGIYIYAYLVQQCVVRYWPGTPSLAGSLPVAVLLTCAVAWCSWHAVEAPALQLKRRLRRWFPDHAA
ncbi:acyltransferase family protein [Frateuria hangzhouensis]|uniref:acyltransferase family protein n=1 Tax=Frateuria hangzhouensis TaxID=2995589 RepID=UPI002260A3EE|nr:acyltransferase [Frateuria sp. STR12]MCX7512508.1 acyltransferase [Frateuria sp. STR12]